MKALLDLLFERYSVGFFLQLSAIVFIMIYNLAYRKKPYIRVPASIVVCTALCFAFPTIEFFGWMKPFFLVAFIFVALVVFVCFDINFRQSLFWAMVAYVVQNFTYHIYAIICVAIGYDEYIDGAVYIIFNWLGSFVLALFMRVFVVGRMKREISVGLTNKAFIGIVGIVVFVVFVLNSLMGLGEVDAYAYIMMHVFASTCCMLTLLVQFGSFVGRFFRKRTEIMEQILRVEQEQHELSRENIDIINMKCHDLKHQINALRRAASGDRDKMLDEIEQAVMIYDSVAKTGNDALDVLLTEKSLYCGKYGIRLACMADGKNLSFMNPADIYSLFGNMLDNAIESLMRVEDPDKRVISLNISAKGRLLLVHTENYFEGGLVFSKGLPQTTKSDKNSHGFGMQSMKYIAEKYGGELAVSTENGMFRLDMVIPIEERDDDG